MPGPPRQNHRAVVRKCPTWEEPPTASSSLSLCGTSMVVDEPRKCLWEPRFYTRNKSLSHGTTYLPTHIQHRCCRETWVPVLCAFYQSTQGDILSRPLCTMPAPDLHRRRPTCYAGEYLTDANQHVLWHLPPYGQVSGIIHDFSDGLIDGFLFDKVQPFALQNSWNS